MKRLFRSSAAALACLAFLTGSAWAASPADPLQPGAGDPIPPRERTTSTRPTAPGGLWAAQTTAKEITLVWRGPSGTAQYRLHDVTNKAAKPVVLAGTVNRYVIPNVVPGRIYQYAIEAQNAQGQTSERATFNAVTPLDMAKQRKLPGQPPQNVVATQTGPNEVTVTWEAVEGATGYAIQRAVSPDGYRVLCALCPTTTRFVDRSPVPGAAHYYAVHTVSPQPQNLHNASNALMVLANPPGAGAGGSLPAPVDVRAFESVQLSWVAVPGATGYRIERVTADGQAETIERIFHGATTRAIVAYAKGGRPNAAQLRIIAVFPQGESAPSVFGYQD